MLAEIKRQAIGAVQASSEQAAVKVGVGSRGFEEAVTREILFFFF
jgi:hypothetical protein